MSLAAFDQDAAFSSMCSGREGSPFFRPRNRLPVARAVSLDFEVDLITAVLEASPGPRATAAPPLAFGFWPAASF